VTLLRGLVRLLAFLLLVLLAVAGLAAAVFSIQGGEETLSLGNLASLLGLPEARDAIAGWLRRVPDPDGPVALVALLCGMGAMLLGLLLLLGLLAPRRERLVQLEQRGEGALVARRRPLAGAARALAEQARGVTGAKVSARPRRGGGGSLLVRAERTRGTDASSARTAIEQQLEPLTEPFRLRARVLTRVGGRGSRVQ
jgi:hypothetical protein